MSQAGTAYVDFEGRFDGLLSGVEKALAPLTGKFGKIGAAAAIGLAGIGTAAIGAGAALFSIGDKFDEAYDTIRVGTGKTGKALDGLKSSFKNVVRDVPTDFKSAAGAITDVNRRLGLTGKPLEALSEQFLELSRITKTDLSTNIREVTRLFGDWGVKTKDQTGKLDELFRASQATGVPVDRLASIMTKFGGPLRQLGFSFEDAAAMAGKFEKEGVNTELVMGSMRIALGRMAKDGEKPAETLRRVTEEIKNAGSAGEANRKAIELFGARAGPDMAAAIREGRFELDNLTKTIKGGKDTIREAGKDTQDFGEKWQMFKNRVLVAIEPIATRFFNLVGDGMDALSKVDLSSVIRWFKELGRQIADVVGPAIEALKKVWDKVGPPLIEGFKDFVSAITGFIGGLIDVLKGVIDFISGIFSGDWKRVWDGIKQVFEGVWNAMKSIVEGLVNGIKNAVLVAFRLLATLLDGIWSGIKSAASAAWNAIKGIVTGAVDAVVNLVKGIAGRVAEFATTIWNGLKSAVTTAWDTIKNTIDGAIDAIIGFIRAIPGRLGEFVGAIWNGIKTAFNTVKNAIGDGVDAIIGFIRKIPGAIPKTLFQPLIDAFNFAYDFIKGKAQDTSAVISGIGQGLDSAIRKADQLNYKTGAALAKLTAAGLAPKRPPVVPNPDQQRIVHQIAGTSSLERTATVLFDPDIQLFIGDEPIDARVRIVVDGINREVATAVSGGIG